MEDVLVECFELIRLNDLFEKILENMALFHFVLPLIITVAGCKQTI